jgi:hypothetical protein
MMAGLMKKSLEHPEEVRSFKDGMGKLELVNLAEGSVGRATFQPCRQLVQARQAHLWH